MDDLLVALARVPRNLGEGGDASLIRALARDFGFDGFDPLDCNMGEPWGNDNPAALASLTTDPWRTKGDTVERLEMLAAGLVSGEVDCENAWTATRAVMEAIRQDIQPSLEACGPSETTSILAASQRCSFLYLS